MDRSARTDMIYAKQKTVAMGIMFLLIYLVFASFTKGTFRANNTRSVDKGRRQD
jgi:hypothetical protein